MRQTSSSGKEELGGVRVGSWVKYDISSWVPKCDFPRGRRGRAPETEEMAQRHRVVKWDKFSVAGTVAGGEGGRGQAGGQGFKRQCRVSEDRL